MLELMIFFWGGGGWGEGTRVSDFFTKNPNLKKRFYFSLFGGGGGVTKDPNLISLFGGGWGGEGGVRWLN